MVRQQGRFKSPTGLNALN
ncbi:unnamed protein product, partial [Vitis vinifera]|uniref:Uncharacterized protein n=1 Tax=Vitis vinifera TaxID=29760 RepID=D7THP6_VITVI